MGDILLTTPLIRSLKNTNPGLQLDFVLREEYEDLLINNVYVNKIYRYTNHKFEKQILFNSILDEEYDLALDLQNNIRSRELVRTLNCNSLKFKKNNYKKFLLVRFKINKLKGAPPIPVRYLEVLDDITLDNNGLDFFTDNDINSKLNKSDSFIWRIRRGKNL